MLRTLDPGRTILEELLRGGQMWSRVIRKGQVLRLVDLEGGATPAALFYNPVQPLERYNMPDTLKAQHIARLSRGACLYSDMGRVLMSVIDDSAGWHDTMTGHMTRARSEAKFGAGPYQTLRNDFHRNTRDNFLIELGKHGLGERDLTPCVNFFVKVAPDGEGRLAWHDVAKAGNAVELRAEMDVLVVLSNTPHPWDPETTYAPKPVQLTVWKADPVTEDDVCRTFRPENERGFRLTEEYVA
jgi:urea carboxylase-associated protein 2